MKLVILDNIRSVYNVGSIFRTCNAVGIDTVFLCGITPTPLDKKGRVRNDFAKVALRAEDKVKWRYFETSLAAVDEAKKEGFYVIAIEQNKRSIDYKSIDVSTCESVAFLIGNEVEGIHNDLLSKVDAVAEIPMLGTKESLNVTIAFGIAAYRILGV